MFTIFYPSLHDSPNISEEIKSRYAYWRIRIFYSMYIGYTFFYITRKSFTFAMPIMISELGFTKVQLGTVASIFYIMYGISKFLSGMLSDNANPRYFMSVGLILTGVCNICFGLSSSMIYFTLFWALNGWFQGWGWPPCARLLVYWYSHTERGIWWSVWNTSHNLGGAMLPLIVAALISKGWFFGTIIPGICAIFVGFFLMNRIRDTPESLGLPPIEGQCKQKPNEESSKTENGKESKLLRYVFRNKHIWMLGIAYLFIYIVRTSVSDWGLFYLYESMGFSFLEASVSVFWFEVGGFLGGLFVGWCSDIIFESRRGPINVLFMFFTLCFLILFYMLVLTPFTASCLMFILGFLIFGPQMLIGIAAVELSHKDAAGTTTGFVGCFAYLGAAFAGFPLGLMVHNLGWDIFVVILIACSIVSVFVLLPFWSTKQNNDRIHL